MKPSVYQQSIYKEYNSSNKNLFIEAGPGSGKTTTILELLNQTQFYKKKLLVAFNKSIADEIRTKVNGTADVFTIHSISYRQLLKRLDTRFNLKELKSFILGKKFYHQYLKEYKDEKKQNAFLFKSAKLIDLYRLNLTDTTLEEFMRLNDEYGADLTETEVKRVLIFADYLEEYNEKREKGFIIDFTDQLWLTKKFVKNFPKYDVVFIDEIQDLNPLQKYIVDKFISNSGRFVAVGDSRQAIYSFMGSNLDSLNSIKNTPGTVSLPLSVSYRCSRRIVDYANLIFPGLEAQKNSKEGEVRLGKFTEISPGDFVICRNNLPLIDAYIDLVGKKLRTKILGKDLGESLIRLLDSINTIQDLDIILRRKEDELLSIGVKTPKSTKNYQSLLEKCDILKSIHSRYLDFKSMRNTLSEMFTETYDSSDIVLMTGHKSKGLENERVFFLYPELIPSKYAVSELDMYQEKCLEYVIVTRAKKSLIFVQDLHKKYC